MTTDSLQSMEETAPSIPQGAHQYFLGLSGVGFIVLLAALVGYGVFGERITSGLNEACAEAFLDAGQKLLRAENCQVLDVETDDSGERTCSVVCGDPDDVFRLETIDTAINAERSLAVVEEMSEATSESVVLPGTRSVLCAPIFVRARREAS